MKVLQKWHEIVETKNPKLLNEILAEEVVFHSPVVFTPQVGKMITYLYLSAAVQVLGNNTFKYIKEIANEQEACLEFTTEIDGIIINGVDILTFNKKGEIIEFKVMVRPYKGMLLLKEKMFELMQSKK